MEAILDDLRKKRDDLLRELESGKNKKSASQLEYEAALKELERLNQRIADLEKRISDLEKLLASLQREFDGIKIQAKVSYEINEEGDHLNRPTTVVSPVKLLVQDSVSRVKAQTVVEESRN